MGLAVDGVSDGSYREGKSQELSQNGGWRFIQPLPAHQADRAENEFRQGLLSETNCGSAGRKACATGPGNAESKSVKSK